MARFVIGTYKRYPTAKCKIKRMDIVLKGQTAKGVAKRVANIHGYALCSLRTKTMTEKQYRKKFFKKY